MFMNSLFCLVVSNEEHETLPFVVDFPCPEKKLDSSDFDHFSWVVQLPLTGWTWSFHNSNLICSNIAKTDEGNFFTKSVEVVTRERVILHMGGKKVSPKAINCHFSTTQELGLIIKDFDALNRCRGIVNTSLADIKLFVRVFRNGRIDQNGHLRSMDCEEYAELNFLCDRCKRITKQFSKMKKGEEGKAEKHFCKTQHKKRQLQYMKNRLVHANNKIKVISLS